jgi:hypothetical protein
VQQDFKDPNTEMIHMHAVLAPQSPDLSLKQRTTLTVATPCCSKVTWSAKAQRENIELWPAKSQTSSQTLIVKTNQCQPCTASPPAVVATQPPGSMQQQLLDTSFKTSCQNFIMPVRITPAGEPPP